MFSARSLPIDLILTSSIVPVFPSWWIQMSNKYASFQGIFIKSYLHEVAHQMANVAEVHAAPAMLACILTMECGLRAVLQMYSMLPLQSTPTSRSPHQVAGNLHMNLQHTWLSVTFPHPDAVLSFSNESSLTALGAQTSFSWCLPLPFWVFPRSELAPFSMNVFDSAKFYLLFPLISWTATIPKTDLFDILLLCGHKFLGELQYSSWWWSNLDVNTIPASLRTFRPDGISREMPMRVGSACLQRAASFPLNHIPTITPASSPGRSNAPRFAAWRTVWPSPG